MIIFKKKPKLTDVDRKILDGLRSLRGVSIDGSFLDEFISSLNKLSPDYYQTDFSVLSQLEDDSKANRETIFNLIHEVEVLKELLGVKTEVIKKKGEFTILSKGNKSIEVKPLCRLGG